MKDLPFKRKTAKWTYFLVQYNLFHWYNFGVPTPFYHLHFAETLLKKRSLPNGIQELLEQNQPSFLLGNIAPDVQVISGQSRPETHFYKLPISENQDLPWKSIQTRLPDYATLCSLSPSAQTFCIGYFCHLWVDWLWTVQIFEPIFGNQNQQSERPRRLYLHNVLRSYIDLQIISALNGKTGPELYAAPIFNDFPFIDSKFLDQWRNFLVEQLRPGVKIQTVEIFATRHGIDPNEFYRLLQSEADLETELFGIVPRQQVDSFWDELFVNVNDFLLDVL